MPTPVSSTLLDRPHGHLYKSHGMDNEYVFESGVFALPVAENAPTNPTELATWSPVVVVTAHAPYQRRIVRFDTKKDGAPPMIPAPQTNAGAFTFLSGSLYFNGPRLNTSAHGFIWQAEGQYEYVVNTRSHPDDGFPLGSLPFPSLINVELAQTITGATPQFGAVAQAGPDVKMGYAEASNVNLSGSSYTYWTPTFFPPTHLNTGMVNGSGTF